MGFFFLVAVVCAFVSMAVLLALRVLTVLTMVVAMVSVEFLDSWLTILGLPLVTVTSAQNKCRSGCK